jgi:transcriptional regulator with XRE-family HTH domain
MSAAPEQIALARRLRSSRVDAGMSQAEVADAVGLSRVAVAEIEAGRRKVSSIELSAFARAYGRPLEYLLGTRKGVTDVVAGSPVMTHLARTAKKLAVEDQQQLLRFAEYLRSESRRKREGGS